MRPATLLIRSGLFQGTKYPIDGTFRIGRHPDNQLQLTDHMVSRFHAIIEAAGQGFRVRDLGSRNGTWVGGHRIKESHLNQGDQIRIGRVLMEFLEEDPEERGAEEAGAFYLPQEATVQVRHRSPADPEIALNISTSVDAKLALLPEHLSRLQTLYHANILLSSQMELEEIFRQILEQLFRFLPADRGVILLMDPHTEQLRKHYSLMRSGEPCSEQMLLSRTIVREVLQEGYGLLIDDAQSDRRLSLIESIVEQGIHSALCVPLIHQGETLGMIYLDSLVASSAFKEEDLQMLTAMAAPAAVQIRNVQYVDQLTRSYLDTIQVLANAIEARDHYTVGHTWRVTRLALVVVDELGWSPKRRRYAEMGGILHDIGKIAVEDAILRKKGSLTAEEYEKMRLHPEHGARILKDVEFLKPTIPFILFHQERWDGKGYPFQLKGEDVPVEGRLLAVCDAFDAMTSDRPYRTRLDPTDALEEVRQNRGRQFDPQMVDIFVDLWDQGKIASILQHFDRTTQSVPCPFCGTPISLGARPREGVILECPVCAKQCVILREEAAWKAALA